MFSLLCEHKQHHLYYHLLPNLHNRWFFEKGYLRLQYMHLHL
nr:MAG TPA: hypothetical protein [Caudoviricetes sp.]